MLRGPPQLDFYRPLGGRSSSQNFACQATARESCGRLAQGADWYGLLLLGALGVSAIAGANRLTSAAQPIHWQQSDQSTDWRGRAGGWTTIAFVVWLGAGSAPYSAHSAARANHQGLGVDGAGSGGQIGREMAVHITCISRERHRYGEQEGMRQNNDQFAIPTPRTRDRAHAGRA
jgi:hypothetical protein